jgi:hypothetical protein
MSLGPVVIALAVVMAGLVVAACASTGSTGTIGAGNNPLALAQCMHSHGVPNFPDPTNGPGGAGLSVSKTPGGTNLTVNGIMFSGPTFQAAVRACGLFGGRSGPPPITEAMRHRLLSFAQCMRAHGASDFPDPNFSSPGTVFRAKIPNHNAPAFQQAVRTCREH